MIMKIARALHKRTKGDKGFTLIELIVVIAVLGVLATLLIPRVVEVPSEAKTKAMEANEKIIKNALERYYLKHGEYPKEEEGLDVLVTEGYLDEIPYKDKASGVKWNINDFNKFINSGSSPNGD